MPTPDPRRRPLARPAAGRPPPPTRAPAEGVAPTSRTSRTTRTHSRRTAPEGNKKQVALIAGGFIVVALALTLFLLLHGREPAASPAATSRPAAPPPAESPRPDDAAAKAAAEAPKPAAPVAKIEPPKPVARPTMEAIVRRMATATTAAVADACGRDAESIQDLKLADECWRKAFELDPNDADARAKLDVRPLDPAADLPGFDAIRATTQRVHLKPFEEAARVDLLGKARAELIARWTKLRPELEARAAKSKSEPFWNEVDELRLALPQRKFFADLEYEMVELPPYALFVEVEGKPEEREKRRLAAEQAYKPFLEAYDKRIRSYLIPLAPKPPDKDPVFPVFVFLNEARYHAYQTSNHGGVAPGMRAHFEPWTKHCFTYSPVLKVGLGGAFEVGAQALLHELTHAWVDRLASKDGGETRGIESLASHWFSEGIAEYMSCQFIDKGEVRFQPWRSMRVGAGSYHPPGWRIPVRDALEITMHGLDSEAARRTAELPPEKRTEAIVAISSGFYADMSNFILWLNLRSGANRPREFEAYAREELAGRGGLDAFKRCVPGLLDQVKDLDKAVDEFVLHIANGKINPYQEFEEAEKPAAAPSKK
jgi:hypothetical protein